MAKTKFFYCATIFSIKINAFTIRFQSVRRYRARISPWSAPISSSSLPSSVDFSTPGSSIYTAFNVLGQVEAHKQIRCTKIFQWSSVGCIFNIKPIFELWWFCSLWNWQFSKCVIFSAWTRAQQNLNIHKQRFRPIVCWYFGWVWQIHYQYQMARSK